MIEINNQFIKQHDRLVRVIVNQFKVANVDPEDLMQEGRIGLIEAAKRFDPNRGIQFASYASWWIRGYVSQGLRDFGNAIHLPQHNREAADKCISVNFEEVMYVEDGDFITYADVITDGRTVEEEYIDAENYQTARQKCEKLLAKLPPQELKVIKGLYGFETEPKTTLELARELGVTQEWIVDLHHRALRRMR